MQKRLAGKQILITSALPYVNNVPHLGNIIGCVLSADVFARYCRSMGYPTLFVCGTDEYGTATEAKALEEGVSPKELCDRYYLVHKKIYEWFGISTDIFGRTSTPLHTQITQEIFLSLYRNGYIKEDEIIQAYDEKIGMFLADRFIEGTCPHCGFEQARADQCDKCGRLLNFDELVNPISKLTKTVPTKRTSRHLFIDLPGIEKKLEQWIEKTAKDGEWSENSYKIAKAWLAEGLKKRCITRDLKWGVPVPLKGWEHKVFYVWFDAPIGYISITANYTSNWKEWWQNPHNVLLFQFMGKDNVPFHAVIFPSTLMGTGQDWTLVHHLSTTEFLNYEGGKFSKSRKIGVFGDDAIESGIPADVWRYYLLANRPEKTDSDFTWRDFGQKINNELLANLGNLVNRTLVFAHRQFDGIVPPPQLSDEDIAFLRQQKEKFDQVSHLLEHVQLKDALHVVMQISKEANGYFQRNQPWQTAKENNVRCATTIFVLLHQLKDLAIGIEPFLPFTSKSIFEQINSPQKKWEDIGNLSIQPGHKLGAPKILFHKIEDSQLASLSVRYGAKTKELPTGQFSVIPESWLDLEIGQIMSIRRHPSADKLYIEQIRLGGGEERQIVSGLVPYYKPEELEGKKIVLVKNLQPAVIRGVESQGMLLAVQDKDGNLEVLSADAPVGAKASISQGASQPFSQPAKITIEQFFTVKLEVIDGIFFANGKKVLFDGKPLTTKKVLNGKVS
ncbi:MAG: methionine--tRNA ligase [Candidatus Micrarchaeota archaeon]|nr:methionine--tRNA ligase [Candidatus Micrarchaeota archaeon]